MSRLSESATDHGDYVVQLRQGSRWVDVEYLTVMANQQPIDAFGDWLDDNDEGGSYRLVEVLDEEDR